MSDNDNDDVSSQNSDGDVNPEQSLVLGRAKRSTAGNRLSLLLQAYGDEDVQADLLKDEEEDQVDYEASDDGGDIDLESSDESGDEGPPKEGEAEKLEGEKELQKQERVEARKKKRKAQDALKIPPPRKKKVRLADDASTTSATADTQAAAASRPRKKSERTSWLPTVEDAPTRQSRRNATMLNKELTEVKLKASQKRSEKAHELLRIAAEKRAANAAPVLSQADRIARALETEKENSKSLNKWVQVEEERRAAQRRRLEAMRNRQIQGPVFSYWSASVIWEGEKIVINRVHKPKVEPVEDDSGKTSTTAPVPVSELQPDAQPIPSPAPTAVNADESSSSLASAPADPTSPQTEKASDVPVVNPSETTPALPEKPELGEQDPSLTRETAGEATTADTSIKADESTRVPDGPGLAAPTDTAPNSESFLDGIHYWASQAPATGGGGGEAATDTIPRGDQSIAAPPNAPGNLTEPSHVVSEAQSHNSSTAQSIDSPRPLVSVKAHLADAASVAAPETPVTAQDTTLLHVTPKAAIDVAHIEPPNTFPSAPPYVFAGCPSDFDEAIASGQPSSKAELTPTGTVEGAVSSTPAPPAVSTAPLLREKALQSLLTLIAFAELENLPPAPPPPPPTASSRAKVQPPAPSLIAISKILLPESHPTLSAAEQKYLTSRSLKKKGDNFLPDRPAKATCCITAKEAKFRDPKTGMGYRDLAAFKSLQRAVAGGCSWSVDEGVWMGIVGDGRMGRVAQGVPEGFWRGVLPSPPPTVAVEKVEEPQQQQQQQQLPVTTTSSQPTGASTQQVQAAAPAPLQPTT
ncbi:hypothetical protein AAFC00_004086 [Neodothiora populina]|uniref:Vps72/YL1 C-terminal domain-containing protein n=1 Tax=Neodothiora populina TaxID=2781224 RepID=A0ABR3PIQ6_9PEZI